MNSVEEVTMRMSASVMITPVSPGMVVKATYSTVCGGSRGVRGAGHRCCWVAGCQGHAHRLVGVDGVQPLAALQVHVREHSGEAAVGGSLALVVALQVEEVGDGVHSWTGDRQSPTRQLPVPSCPVPVQGYLSAGPVRRPPACGR